MFTIGPLRTLRDEDAKMSQSFAAAYGTDVSSHESRTREGSHFHVSRLAWKRFTSSAAFSEPSSSPSATTSRRDLR